MRLSLGFGSLPLTWNSRCAWPLKMVIIAGLMEVQRGELDLVAVRSTTVANLQIQKISSKCSISKTQLMFKGHSNLSLGLLLILKSTCAHHHNQVTVSRL